MNRYIICVHCSCAMCQYEFCMQIVEYPAPTPRLTYLMTCMIHITMTNGDCVNTREIPTRFVYVSIASQELQRLQQFFNLSKIRITLYKVRLSNNVTSKPPNIVTIYHSVIHVLRKDLVQKEPKTTLRIRLSSISNILSKLISKLNSIIGLLFSFPSKALNTLKLTQRLILPKALSIKLFVYLIL